MPHQHFGRRFQDDIPGGVQTVPDHFLGGDFPTFKWEQIRGCIPGNSTEVSKGSKGPVSILLCCLRYLLFKKMALVPSDLRLRLVRERLCMMHDRFFYTEKSTLTHCPASA